jgi:hypothetical protein
MSQVVTTQTAAATYSVKVPVGCTAMRVELWGCGGGGSTRSTTGGGGGGGGGEYAINPTLAVSPALTYNYVVPAAGTPGATGSDCTFNATSVVAKPGASVAANTDTGGVAGTGGTGSTLYAGGAGATGVAGDQGGGGGGSGGTGSIGNTAPAADNLGATAVTGGGPGGDGKNAPQGSGSAPASGPGGGGGGGLRTSSGTRSGGNGFAGQARITYENPHVGLLLLGMAA